MQKPLFGGVEVFGTRYVHIHATCSNECARTHARTHANTHTHTHTCVGTRTPIQDGKGEGRGNGEEAEQIWREMQEANPQTPYRFAALHKETSQLAAENAAISSEVLEASKSCKLLKSVSLEIKLTVY